MIPAVRLVPPGHTLVTPGKRFFGGFALYHDRAPRGARRVGGRLRRSLSSHPPSIPCMRFSLTRLCCYPSLTPFTQISLPQAGDIQALLLLISARHLVPDTGFSFGYDFSTSGRNVLPHTNPAERISCEDTLLFRSSSSILE